MLFACTGGKQQHKPALMYNSQLSVIANYRACLLELRDLVDLFGSVSVCVAEAFNDGGSWSPTRDVSVLW